MTHETEFTLSTLFCEKPAQKKERRGLALCDKVETMLLENVIKLRDTEKNK